MLQNSDWLRTQEVDWNEIYDTQIKISELAIALNIEPYKLLKDENDMENMPNRLDKITKTRKRKPRI